MLLPRNGCGDVKQKSRRPKRQACLFKVSSPSSRYCRIMSAMQKASWHGGGPRRPTSPGCRRPSWRTGMPGTCEPSTSSSTPGGGAPKRRRARPQCSTISSGCARPAWAPWRYGMHKLVQELDALLRLKIISKHGTRAIFAGLGRKEGSCRQLTDHCASRVQCLQVCLMGNKI